MSGLEIMPLMMIAGTAVSAGGKIMSGMAQADAAAAEAQNYRIQEQQYRTAAAQDEAKRRTELTSAIDTVLAVRTGRGLGLSSPTMEGILADLTFRSESDIFTQRTGLETRADQSSIASEMADRKARMSLVAGDIGAFSDIATAPFKYKRATSGVGSIYT